MDGVNSPYVLPMVARSVGAERDLWARGGTHTFGVAIPLLCTRVSCGITRRANESGRGIPVIKQHTAISAPSTALPVTLRIPYGSCRVFVAVGRRLRVTQGRRVWLCIFCLVWLESIGRPASRDDSTAN